MTAHPGALIGHVPAPALHVMTLNVRRPLGRLTWPPADRWSVRAPRLRALLALERPSVLGTQEAMPSQVALMREALGCSYRHIGYGRDADRRGEGCPIVYDTDRLELGDWAQLALSETPDVAGSKSWGNWLPRIAVRATFLDRVTGVQFVVINTHLDPFSARSRVRSAELIGRWAADESSPVIVSGDFNSRPDSPSVSAMLEQGALGDAWKAAAVRLTPEWETFGGYRTPHADGARIDLIAVSTDVRVDRIGINARRVDGGWPSDHLPVQAVIRLSEEEGVM